MSFRSVVIKARPNISLINKRRRWKISSIWATRFLLKCFVYQQEKEYLAIIKDGAELKSFPNHPAKSSVVATLQYLILKGIWYWLHQILFGRIIWKTQNGAQYQYLFKTTSQERFPKLLSPNNNALFHLRWSLCRHSKAKAMRTNLKNAKTLKSYSGGVWEWKLETKNYWNDLWWNICRWWRTKNNFSLEPNGNTIFLFYANAVKTGLTLYRLQELQNLCNNCSKGKRNRHTELRMNLFCLCWLIVCIPDPNKYQPIFLKYT